MKKNCIICDAEFEGRPDRKYCGDECRVLARRQRRKRPLMEKNCVYCDIKFPTNQVFAKYCGDECLAASLSCTICPHVGKDSHELKRHIRRRHTPIPCRGCSKDFTKHEANTVGEFCSPECRKENKTNWSKEYAQKPEVKHRMKLNARKYVARRKAENPEWGLAPLIEKPCRYCGTEIEARGHSNRTLFCDDVCQAKHSRQYQDNKLREYREATLERMSEITCIVCGDTKLTYHSHTKFCSKKCRAKHENSQPKSKARKLKWQREQRKDPNSWFNQTMQTIANRIRGQVRQALKCRGFKKTNKTFLLLGYTKYELKEHLESYFTEESGYTWDNMSKWHIDHIRPIASFDFDSTDHPDFKKCWALNNLQPLWAADNMSKGNKWDGVVA
jgi:predicted nucleic acid-binding Zn ribbon protein